MAGSVSMQEEIEGNYLNLRQYPDTKLPTTSTTMQLLKKLLPVLAIIICFGGVEGGIDPDNFSGAIIRRDVVVIGSGSAGVRLSSTQA